MSSKQNVIEDALRLSEAERLEVAEAVYESLEGPGDADAEQAWDQEIARRAAEIDSGQVKLVRWSEARRQIAGDEADAPRTCTAKAATGSIAFPTCLSTAKPSSVSR